jgi:hypothetical protein
MKRIFALICALAMTLSLTVTAFGYDYVNLRDDPEQKNFFIGIEKRVDIPKEFDFISEWSPNPNKNGHFSYEWHESEYDAYVIDDNGIYPSEYVVKIKDDVILYFYFDDRSEFDYISLNKLGTISPSDYFTTARKHLEKANPGASKLYNFTDYETTVYDRYITVTLTRVVGTKETDYKKDYIKFDKNTGSLVEFDLSSLDMTDKELLAYDSGWEDSSRPDKTYIYDWIKNNLSSIMHTPFDKFSGIIDKEILQKTALLWANNCNILPYKTDGNTVIIDLSRDLTYYEWASFISVVFPSSADDVMYYVYIPYKSDYKDTEMYYAELEEYVLDTTISRYEAVKLFAEAAAGDRVSRYARLYDDFYPDIKADDDLAGAIAVCVAEGLLVPDGKPFNPDDELTLEEAINWFYNFYTQES